MRNEAFFPGCMPGLSYRTYWYRFTSKAVQFEEDIPQGLKRRRALWALSARLKSCPFKASSHCQSVMPVPTEARQAEP